MKRLLFAAGAALFVSGAAHASITPVLDSITPVGPNFEFDYHVSLSGDQGLKKGSTLVIFDFAGDVPGSLFIDSPDWSTAVVNLADFDTSTGGVQVNPMYNDDAGIPDLVFVYTGPDFHTQGGPFADQVVLNLHASSNLGGMTLTGFSARSIINNGLGTVGSPSFNNGAVGVPAAFIPEPGSWALLIAGFGGVGTLLRARRRRTTPSIA